MLLANQYKILEKLCPDEAESYSVLREALEEGYEIEYNLNAEYISKDVMTREESLKVKDTLEMFDSIKASAENLGQLEWLEEKNFIISGIRWKL
ncbi:MAG: YfbU family protein [Rhodobacteraceae bacterium]|nr:YfbU family protein [Paracoccaceae bacterium]MCY4249504.1 YfbU family protein [Paracoccaceae bacterium]